MVSVSLRISIFLIGLGFVAIGLAGLFRPSEVAEALALMPKSPIGLGSIRLLVGAHYLAMGLTAIYAAVRQSPTLLVPLAAIEVSVLAARSISGFAGELSSTGMVATGLEAVASLVFTLGVLMPARANTAQRSTM